jgi:hypothetical protein
VVEVMINLEAEVVVIPQEVEAMINLEAEVVVANLLEYSNLSEREVVEESCLNLVVEEAMKMIDLSRMLN